MRSSSASIAQPLAPGAVLAGGRVRLLRPIAAGGMGEVWIAVNEATGGEIAAKVWRRAGDATATRERFTHEAQLGAKLSHRSIVRIFDLVAEPDGTLVLLMELLRGQTLEQRLASHGPLPARDAVAIVVPILSALDHAHRMGVVHRDVKPANIFLAVDPDGTTTPKLLDFGIAKVPAAGNHTVDGHVLGTPRYMSPEHIRGKTDLDGRSDLFSVATVLVEMLTGRAPFAGATPSATLAAVLEQEVDPEPWVDARLWNEIARALSKRPYERHRNAAEFAAALCTAIGATEAELAGSLPKVEPPSYGAIDHGSADLVSEVPSRSIELTSRTQRRHRATWVVVAAAAVAVGVVAMAATRRARDDTPAATTAPPPTASASADVRSPPTPSPVVSADPPTLKAPAAPSQGSTLTTTRPVAPPAALPPGVSPRPRPASPPPATPQPQQPRAVATTPGF